MVTPQQYIIINQFTPITSGTLPHCNPMAGKYRYSPNNTTLLAAMVEVLDEVRVFRSLSDEERDALSQRMTAVEYLADQVILGVGEHSEHLLVIGSGVVSASVRDGDKRIEAGRMGPGEVLGIEGIIDDEDSLAEFRTLTSCVLYRIDKEQVKSCLQQRGEVQTALSKLQRFRRQSRDSLLLQKPTLIKKGGFLSWLHK